MPDMPSEFYIPALGFMISIIASLTTAVRVLWKNHLEMVRKLNEANEHVIRETTAAIVLNSEALRENTYALGSIRSSAIRGR